MVIAEVAFDPACELSEFLFCELMLFSKSLNLRVCVPELCVCILELFVRILEKVHNEAKTLVNKTPKVNDVFRGSLHRLLSFSLSGLQFLHPRIELCLLL